MTEGADGVSGAGGSCEKGDGAGVGAASVGGSGGGACTGLTAAEPSVSSIALSRRPVAKWRHMQCFPFFDESGRESSLSG